jgi:hypothetical protein
MIQNILDRKGSEVVTVRATDTIKAAADSWATCKGRSQALSAHSRF